MTNKPMLSVERELLERVSATKNMIDFLDAMDELRALLDKPDDVLPCDVKVAPGTIIRKGCKVSALMACIGARSGLDDKFTQLIEPAAQHQGEPVAWRNIATGHVTISAVVVMDWDDEKEQVQYACSESAVVTRWNKIDRSGVKP